MGLSNITTLLQKTWLFHPVTVLAGISNSLGIQNLLKVGNQLLV